jgi:hypothetical protein
MARKAGTPVDDAPQGVDPDTEAAADEAAAAAGEAAAATPDAAAQTLTTDDEIDRQRGDVVGDIVAARRRREFLPPAGDKAGDTDADTPADPSEDTAGAPEAGDDADKAAPATAGETKPDKSADQPDDPLIDVKVNGEVRQMKLSEVVAAAQKTVAADDYLATARATLEEARAARAEFRAAQQPTGQPAGADATPGAKAGDDQQTVDALANIDFGKLVEQIQYADPAEAGAALKATISEAVKAAGGGQAVEEIVAQRVSEEVERTSSQQRMKDDFNAAIAEFGTQHPTIFQDDDLGKFASNEFLMIYQAAAVENQRSGASMPNVRKMLADAADRTYQFVERLGGELARPGAEAPKPKPGETVVELDPERDRRKADSATPAGRGGVHRGPTQAPQQPTQIEMRQQAVQESIATRNRRKGVG